MRFLVVTLHAGESEFERCLGAIAEQQGVEVEHVVFSDLPNVEAHRRCYATIEERQPDYDVAVKIDADMVLRSSRALEAIGDLFAGDPELDHAQLGLHDFYTDGPIMGMQAYSPRVRWDRLEDALFVDPSPSVLGHRAVVAGPPAPVADHSPDPSDLQAFRFGVHRAAKAFQLDRKRLRGSQARDQWRTLARTWKAFVNTGDVRRGLAIYGADLVWRGQLDPRQGYRSSDVEECFAAAPRTSRELERILERRWNPGPGRAARLARALRYRGSVRLVAAAGREVLEHRRGDHGG